LNAKWYAPAFVILGIEPVRWLFETWSDDSYGSFGEWIFVLCALLVAISISSPRVAPRSARSEKIAVGLLFATFVVRLIGRMWAVRTIGAIALVIDVYALALAAGLGERRRAISPVFLALLFAMTLPVERIIQRAIGFPFQQISAAGACAILEPIHEGLRCHGTTIELSSTALSVDLPCSGAQGLALLVTLALALATFRVIRGASLVQAGLLSVVGAIGSNAIRLVLIAEAMRLELPAASEPLHSLIGLFTLALGALPILLLARREPLSEREPISEESAPIAAKAPRLALAIASTVIAIFVSIAPSRPIDASAPVAPLVLPIELGAWRGAHVALSDRESAYFERYGGRAAKARYVSARGTHTVVAVRTRAPLRHLHGPDECLTGSGHRVRLVGVRAKDRSSIYESVAPSGERFRVEVLFFGDDGEVASSASEAAWRWIRAPKTTWTMIERITPWDQCERDPEGCRSFANTIHRVLDASKETT
jgi:exosortase/archaeosortase family protein